MQVEVVNEDAPWLVGVIDVSEPEDEEYCLEEEGDNEYSSELLGNKIRIYLCQGIVTSGGRCSRTTTTPPSTKEQHQRYYCYKHQNAQRTVKTGIFKKPKRTKTFYVVLSSFISMLVGVGFFITGLVDITQSSWVPYVLGSIFTGLPVIVFIIQTLTQTLNTAFNSAIQ